MAAGAQTAAALRVAVLRAEIDKQRSLPVVLAQDPDVQRALEAPDAARSEALNRRLAGLADEARTGVVYLIDAAGHTVAASNYRTPESFLDRTTASAPISASLWPTGGRSISPSARSAASPASIWRSGWRPAGGCSACWC